jgi:CRP-like cAMP-binding protein
MALIDDHRRIGSARALSDTVTRVITSSQIFDCLGHSDEVIAFILRIALMRYRQLLYQVRRAEDSSTRPDPTNEDLTRPDSR